MRRRRIGELKFVRDLHAKVDPWETASKADWGLAVERKSVIRPLAEGAKLTGEPLANRGNPARPPGRDGVRRVNAGWRKLRRWRAGSRGDTSPLPGLAYANAAASGVNAFVPSGLQRFPAGRVPGPLAYANVLILWDGRSFAWFSKSV